MKTIRMKGKTVEEATQAALAVLGVEKAEVKIISEGKPAVLGIIGGEEAEVGVIAKGEPVDEAKQVLQEIVDKMKFLAIVEGKVGEEAPTMSGQGMVELEIKGEEMGRIIGKEGATLRALETIVSSILGRVYGERIRIAVDANGYREKRAKALQHLAQEIADEVEKTGEEKAFPYLESSERRTIHMFLQNHPKVTTFSVGEGRGRRLIVAARK